MKTFQLGVIIDENGEPDEWFSWNAITSLLYSLGYKI